jgi:hypothetical protein
MNDGNYIFSNEILSFDFTISGNGWQLSGTLTDIKLNTKTTLTGEFRSANNIEWYEFKTSECSYEFDVFSDTLFLSSFDCVSGKKDLKYKLIKKVINWSGTYTNSDGGTLVVSNFNAGQGFTYKLTYSGTSRCGGIELTGTATLNSNTTATSGENESSNTFRLDNDQLIFEPNMYEIGIECQKVFDTNFVKAS